MNEDRNPVLGIIILVIVAVLVAGVIASFLLFNGLPPLNPDTNYSVKVATKYPAECSSIFIEYRVSDGINRFGTEVFQDATSRIPLGRADQFSVINTTIHTPQGKDFRITMDSCIMGSAGFTAPLPDKDEITVTELP